MLFSSITFIFYFLPLFLAVYYFLGIRNGVLLAGSALFYTWGEGKYICLLLGLVALNQGTGVLIQRRDGSLRKLILACGITANLATLGFFKYSQFIVDVFAAIIDTKTIKLNIHLPLGISFFTFQLISYLIEIYRRTIPAERNFVRLATYVMMFPHLVAGPIVRYTDISGELRDRAVNPARAELAIQYFIIGLSQKVLIANTMAPVADHVFGLPPQSVTTVDAWLGSFAYTLQIYFDFCGYSNMAIGLALLLGFHFPKNFDYPYASRSITEFWRRWHMSLSFWFRDYLFIPLGGSRCGKVRTVRNLLFVFLVTGLWHGAAWTFVFWGLFHGIFVALERIGLGALLNRAPQGVSRVYTLLVVMAAWVFFRAGTFTQAWVIIRAMVGFGASDVWDPIALWVTPETICAFITGSILSFPVVPWALKRYNRPLISFRSAHPTLQTSPQESRLLPTTVLLCGFLASIALLASGSLNPFLYFRF
ncbi:MBOAT family O-acyltransferase [Paraburkholderia fungorum]|nr:MBOAT family protein [Paraburkholderia fungorum]USU17004.1 MBOAT family protein [Paraburkholderia fungorum]USU24949.1 MBOAT family protein [Paraburkholderia fungorum]